MLIGILVSNAVDAIGYVSTSVRNNDKSWPDIQYTMMPGGIQNVISETYERVMNYNPNIMKEFLKPIIKDGNGEKDANSIYMTLQRPKSVGEITLANRNPFSHPLIQPNYLTHPDDVIALVEGTCVSNDFKYRQRGIFKIISHVIYHIFMSII